MNSSAVVISCEHISKVYGEGHTQVTALRDVNFQVHAGENVAIVGPSGSGKSTLLHILGCLDKPSGGRYLCSGSDVADLDDDALSTLRGRALGFVFQQFHLLPKLSLLDNVGLPLVYQSVPAHLRRERAREALERVRLGHRAEHLPQEISGGEKQRAAIARAIIHNPSLILADEPTGNLDSKVKNEILDYLGDLNRTTGVTLVTITHDHETAERARRKLIMKDGCLQE